MPFPFEDGAGSTVIEGLVGGPAAALTTVALVVAPGARASGWGARAAVALAAAWPGPRRALLADLDLERPTLHALHDVQNDEGVIDLIDYGVSVARLIRSPGNISYDVLPAGLFTADPGAILRHDEWNRVLLEVAARRGTLLALLPAEAEGFEAIVERAGAVLVLAEPGESGAVMERLPHPYAVLGILTPAPAAAPVVEQLDEAPVESHGEPEPDVEVELVVTPAAEPESGEAGGDASIDRPADLLTEAPAESASSSAPESVELVSTSDTPAVDPTAAEPAAAEPPTDTTADETTVTGEATDAAIVTPVEADADSDPHPAEDLSAREDLARTVRERQREARLAGAAPATGPSVATDVERAEAPASDDLPAVDAESAAVTDRADDRTVSEVEATGRPESSDVADPIPTQAVAVAGADPAPPVEYSVAARPAGQPSTGERPALSGQHRSPPPRRERSRYRHPLLWTLGVVLLASLLAGAWHYLSERLEPVAAPQAPAPEPPPPAAPAEQNALPFVVAMEAHRDLPVALNRVADLSEIEPELLFHVEPLAREGTLFYHVMAGPVPDSTSALALRDTLIARGHKTGVTPTDVRATPLAFLIGDYATRGGADEQRDILRRLDIPGYVLEGEAADGAPLYRLYVGGFASDAEADVTRQMLRSAGIRDSLVTRTGRIGATELIAPEGDSATAGDSLATPTGSSNP